MFSPFSVSYAHLQTEYCVLHFKWIRTRDSTFWHTARKLTELADKQSNWRHFPPHIPRINTQSCICICNPWWENRCHGSESIAANWTTRKYFKILILKPTKWVEYSLHHELLLLLGREIVFSKKCVQEVWYWAHLKSSKKTCTARHS
jgi:hypothetical protein